MLKVYETVSLRDRADYMAMIPTGLPKEFLTSDLAHALGRPRHLAQKMAYCLRNGGLIEKVGSQGQCDRLRDGVPRLTNAVVNRVVTVVNVPHR